jgi:rhamnosyltransferase subunit B
VRILVNVVGSLGDILPFMALGAALQGRGHEVRIYGNDYFRGVADELGLHFSATSPAPEYQAFLHAPAATDPRQAMRAVAQGVMGKVASSHAILRADVLPGRTIALGSTFAFAVRLLRETHAVPCTVLHLSPSVLRSEYAAPRFSPLGHMTALPRWVKRAIWAVMDRKFMDPLYTAPFNRIRADLGLAPIERMFHRWLHQADAALCLVAPWFAPRQPDWPAAITLAGFPLVDHGAHRPLPDAIAAFLEAGAAPVVITAGTANAVSHAFFSAAIQACRSLKLRAILVTADPAQLPPALPDDMIHAAYAPFAALLPRACAFIHHGGIGSASQALRAGVPQLIQPMAFDQFDNASHVVQLGAGREVLARHFQPDRVADELKSLLADTALAANCKRHAASLVNENGIEHACDLLLDRLAPHLKADAAL